MAPSLKEQLLNEKNRDGVVDDCVRLIDREVASKRGLTGVAVKGAYGLVKKIKPGIIREAVNALLDPFVAELEPFYASANEAGTSVTSHFGQRVPDIADALLNVTDSRIRRTENTVIRKAYDKLRSGAKKHVETAVPGIAQIIAKYG